MSPWRTHQVGLADATEPASRSLLRSWRHRAEVAIENLGTSCGGQPRVLMLSLRAIGTPSRGATRPPPVSRRRGARHSPHRGQWSGRRECWLRCARPVEDRVEKFCGTEVLGVQRSARLAMVKSAGLLIRSPGRGHDEIAISRVGRLRQDFVAI